MDDLKKHLAVYLLAASYCISTADGQTTKSYQDMVQDCILPALGSQNRTIACVCDDENPSWHLWTHKQWTFDDLIYFRFPFEKNVSQWPEICRSFYAEGTCIKNARPECKLIYGEDIVTYLRTSYAALLVKTVPCFDNRPTLQSFFIWQLLLQFYNYACIDDQLSPPALSVVNDHSPDVNMTCVTRGLLDSQKRCIMHYKEADDDDSRATDTLNCMFSAINRSPCDTAARRVMYFVARIELAYFEGKEAIYADESTTVVDFRSIIRCTVGVYGDPHLKMCLSESLVTCSAPGEQTYISNKYMTIRGNNVVVGVITEPRATTLKSISLTFNSIETGQVIATYNTTNGALPATFDGSTSEKAGSGNDTVEIQVDPSNRIRFVQKGTGAILFLRQWDGNYFFTLRMTETVILDSKGLLNDGCPEDQIVNRDQFLRRRKRQSTPQCTTACYSVGFLDRFYDQCVLDCLATGDLDFATNMSKGSKEDGEVVVTFDQALREGAVRKTINSSPTTVMMNSDVTPTVTERNTRDTGAIQSSSRDLGMTHSTSRPTIDPIPSSGSVLCSGYIFGLIPTSVVIYLLAFK